MLVIRKHRDLKKTLSKIDPDFKSLIVEKPKTNASVLPNPTKNLAATQRDLTALANGIKSIKTTTAKTATLKPVTKATTTTTKQADAIPPVNPVVPVAVDAPLTITSIEPTKAQSVVVSTEDFPPMPPPPFLATASSIAATKPTTATHVGPPNGSFQYNPYSPFGANQINGFYIPSGFVESPFSP
ncbi:hypothetical protein RvY_00827-3 [Ramazzottius varieornatus]|uniref:Uncharacterized protein n=1 Tax=Ramazzottius varieornatus TaxID=947166 RepID=A0A1D1UF14_RAMVA|nr:hypothetical protein RvY_00827-3 [Ramazzottius varieornatus]